MRDLAGLTAADFAGREGAEFRLVRPGPTVRLRLEEVVRLGPRPEGRQPFSLLFRGPGEDPLPQAVHRLEDAELGLLDIFLVPVAEDGRSRSYEAVFG